MLSFEHETDNGALLIALKGELDARTARDFESALMPLLEDVKSVTFDFENLEYISSAGLRVMLLAEQTLEKKGAEMVKIVNMSSMIRELFEITGFGDILAIE